jgi:starch phosphorylase
VSLDDTPQEIIVDAGKTLMVRASVELGGLQPDDVRVELYTGPLSSEGDLRQAETIEMKHEAVEGNQHRYAASCRCAQTGRQGYAVRVVPEHPSLTYHQLSKLIRWAQ